MTRSFQDFPAQHGNTGPVHPAGVAAEGLSHGVKGLEDNSANRGKHSFFKHLCNIPPISDME